jgi:two-component system, OmpR family, sensor kinase
MSQGADRAWSVALVAALLLAAIGTAVTWTLPAGELPGAVLTAAIAVIAATTWSRHRAPSTTVPAAARATTTDLDAAGVADTHGRSISSIAHEIKTPLTTVLAEVDLLLRASTDPIAVRSHAKTIGEDVQHLCGLVDAFLRLAHPSANDDIGHHVPVVVHDLVLEAARRCRALASQSRVRIVPTLAEGDSDDSLEVLGDPILLEAMLENLVRNAVRFSPAGQPVSLQVLVQENTIGVLIRDHGSGIPAANLASVFDWFHLAPERSRFTAGSGFGLAIARRIADHHRGRIALRNHPQGGCEFTVELPRRAPTPI